MMNCIKMAYLQLPRTFVQHLSEEHRFLIHSKLNSSSMCLYHSLTLSYTFFQYKHSAVRWIRKEKHSISHQITKLL